MRTETKIGLVVGVVVLAAGILFLTTSPGKKKGLVPDKNDIAKTSDETKTSKSPIDKTKNKTANSDHDRLAAARGSRDSLFADHSRPSSLDRNRSSRNQRPRSANNSTTNDRRTNSPQSVAKPDKSKTETAKENSTSADPQAKASTETKPNTAQKSTNPKPVVPDRNTTTESKTETSTPATVITEPKQNKPNTAKTPATTVKDTKRSGSPLAGVTSPLTRTTRPTTPAQTAKTPYTVKDGDNLTKIIREHYGEYRATYLEAIKAANPDLNVDVIRIGQTIILPTKSSATSAAATKRTATVAPPIRTRTSGAADRTARTSTTGTVYTVKDRDKLAHVIADHYGDYTPAHLAAVKAANPGLDVNVIRIGQKITLPPKSAIGKNTATSSSRRTATSASRSTDTNKVIIYVVEKGDTLSKIAKNVLEDGSRWKEIFELNKNIIKNPDDIRVGMKLKIPPKK